jgi:hypothetical protein
MKIVVSALLGMLAALLIVTTPSCAQGGAITAAVVGEIDCVETELAKGDDTFEGIAEACAPLAVADVVTIVEAEVAPTEAGAKPVAAAAAAPTEAGAKPVAAAAAKVHHRSDAPPKAAK